MTPARTLLLSALGLVGLAVSGCATTPAPGAAPAPETPPPTASDGLDALLWLQTSPEYAAVTTSLYAAAASVAERLAAGAPERVGSMAIVLDVDETVLDNAPYQARLVLEGRRYDAESWDDWIARRAAGPVPGVVDFLRVSRSLGFHVALITNRECRVRPGGTEPCPQVEDTLANLRRIGIDTASVTLWIRGDRPPAACEPFLSADERAKRAWSSDKTSRRACVASGYEIALMFGDQLGDFVAAEAGDADPNGRRRAADHAERWGRSWFMLPNPTYGSWRPGNSAEKRERISGDE